MWSIRGWIGGSSCDSYGDRKRVFQQTCIFEGHIVSKWRQISKIHHMGFLQNGPFSFPHDNFLRKWWILRDFWDPLNTIFAVAASKETCLSRNSPVQSSIWIPFLLTFVYLRKLEFDCKGGDFSLFEELFLQEDQNAWLLGGWSDSFFSAGGR